ncbi:transcription factor TFIIF complex subunit Tfg3 [Coemansia sp. RSA 2050]|nr:transcription factor TFIIF complex subunit Tfg3 [Coemansia sp. RSA 2050]KAJ2735403.1 transcription factor TFIIF complex subunit Tfg3 [Coemansia sp. BCRC 34962]
MGAESEVTLAVRTQHQQTGHYVQADGVEYSLRTWSCTVQEGRAKGTNALQLPYVKKVEFILHETFENPHRVVSHPPFKVEEEGWGEFDLVIMVHFVNCPEPYKIVHDLNFHSGESYRKSYDFVIPNPSPGFLALFNKHTTVSRKTIPARATKAHKGPPRDSSDLSKHSRPPHHSRGYSSSSSRQSDSGSESDSMDSGSEDDASESRSLHSRSSKARSVSSVSADSAVSSHRGTSKGHIRVADTGKRPIQALKHVPLPEMSPGRSAGKSGHRISEDLCHQRLAASASRSLTTTSGIARSERDTHASLPLPRKKREAVPASGMRRPPNSSTTDSGGAATQRQSPTLATRPSGASDKSVSPTNRAERALAPGTSGVKRRLTEAIEGANSRRHTLGAADPLAVSSLAASIASVKVPKKKTAASSQAASNGNERRSEAVTPPSKRQRMSAAPVRHLALKAGTGSRGELRPSPGAGLSSREAFVRERERNRMLERQRESDLAASSAKPAMASAVAKAPRSIATAPKGGRSGVPSTKSEAALSKSAPKTMSPASSEGRLRDRSPAPAQTKRTGPADMTQKMERIMARAGSLDDRRLVGFLELLHRLRVEQDPERADLITEEAADQVENDGEYACNLSALKPEAIDKLWAFVREVHV